MSHQERQFLTVDQVADITAHLREHSGLRWKPRLSAALQTVDFACWIASHLKESGVSNVVRRAMRREEADYFADLAAAAKRLDTLLHWPPLGPKRFIRHELHSHVDIWPEYPEADWDVFTRVLGRFPAFTSAEITARSFPKGRAALEWRDELIFRLGDAYEHVRPRPRHFARTVEICLGFLDAEIEDVPGVIRAARLRLAPRMKARERERRDQQNALVDLFKSIAASAGDLDS